MRRSEGWLMFLIVGANSEIGSATARCIRERDERLVTTTRRVSEATADQLHLDFEQPIETFMVPNDLTAACIFVAMAKLAAWGVDPVGSARVNIERTLALVDLLTAKEVYTLFLST